MERVNNRHFPQVDKHMMEAWQGVSVRTVNRVLLLGIVCLFALNFTTAEAQAQFEVEVSLQCQPDSVELDVSSGSSGEETIVCQIENGALYEKTVELSITSQGESTSISTSLSNQNLVVAAGATEEVSITFTANLRSPVEDTNFELNATVTKLGSVPLNEQVQSTTSADISASIQGFIDLEYSATAFTLNSKPGETFNISAKVRNIGNVEVEMMFKISNNAELSAMGVECSQLPLGFNTFQLGGYFDEEVMSCTVPDDFEKSKEFTIKMYARAEWSGEQFETADETVKVSIEVPSEGGFGGLTEDLSQEDKQMLIYAGGGLVGVLVLLIVVLKISRRKGGGGVEAWDDEDFDFEL